MLRLIDATGEHQPITGYSDYRIKHVEDGNDTLTFFLDVSHEQYPLLQNETIIQTKDNEWLIKKIDDDKFECSLNFDFLKQKLYQNYESLTRSLSEVLLDHLPDGWTVEGASAITIRRTIRFDLCTDYDIVSECISTYKVRFSWFIREKRLVVYNPEMMNPTGEYLTSELNLRKLSFKGLSTDFATRIYAYGADNMSVADAMVDDGNGGTMRYGKDYIDDLTYSDKIVCMYWKDERYSVPENLYDAALEKLKAVSKPVLSYECDVVDLAKHDPRYVFLEFAMFKKITLIDVERKIRVEHQIIEYTEFPDEPDRNVVTMSSAPETIQSSMKKVADSTQDDMLQYANIFEQRIMMATAMLTGVFGGHVISDGSQIFIMDTDNPSTAKIVWRWGINGIGKSSTGIDGPYISAWTFDDTFITNVIQAMVIRGRYIEANSIHADKINQTYTDGVLSQAFTAAEGLIMSEISELTKYLTNDSGSGELDVLKKTLTTLRQEVDKLQITASESYHGGTNYVRNSAGLNGLSDEWEYTGTVVTLQSSDTKNYTVSNSCFRLSQYATLEQRLDTLVIGKAYTVSIKAKKTADLVDGYFRVIYNGDSLAYLVNTQSTYDWTEYEVQLPDIRSGTIVLEMYSGGDYFYVSDIMVSEGMTKREWTPAPNEIYTENVKVDRRGIEVSNDDSDTRTVINHTEFAVYSGEQKAITVNKDETHLKKSIVEEDLTVGKLKFIPLENWSDGVNIVLLD